MYFYFGFFFGKDRLLRLPHSGDQFAFCRDGFTVFQRFHRVRDGGEEPEIQFPVQVHGKTSNKKSGKPEPATKNTVSVCCHTNRLPTPENVKLENAFLPK